MTYEKMHDSGNMQAVEAFINIIKIIVLIGLSIPLDDNFHCSAYINLFHPLFFTLQTYLVNSFSEVRLYARANRI